VEPLRIERITADADELVAVSSFGNFYFLRFENQSSMVPDLWRMAEGVPSSPLRLSDATATYRSLEIGRRNHEVLYWEDPVGNPHHWGKDGISTLYLLSADGTSIKYFDTGLPADFSHEFCGPERGRFVARALSASGSTVFLINDKAEMYTRLMDFDTVGNNPMFFDYAFDSMRRPEDRGQDPATLFRPIRLPGEPWLRQPDIPQGGRATSRITILQTGEGNAARELRVGAFDPTGRWGYFAKAIFAPRWNFVPTPVPDPLFPLLSATVVTGVSGDRRYVGRANQKSEEVSLTLEDFNLACSPATVTIRDGSGTISARLHTVDVWSYRRQRDPGRDGTPRVLFGTLELDNAGDLSSRSSRWSRSLDRLNREPNALLIRATDRYVEIATVDSPSHPLAQLVAESLQPSTIESLVSDDARRLVGIETQAEDAALPAGATGRSSGSPEALRLTNASLRLNHLTSERLYRYSRSVRRQVAVDRGLARAFDALAFVLRATAICRLPRVRNLCRTGRAVFRGRASFNEALIGVLEEEEYRAAELLKNQVRGLEDSSK
jgi:hypothetical protein